MFDFNRSNPSVLGFHLVRSAPATVCDACGLWQWAGQEVYRCHRLYACSPDCAAELGHVVRAEPTPKCDRAATLRARQCDVVTVFRAAGLV